MAKRLGAVLVFADGVTKEEATAALAKIVDVLSPHYHLDPADKTYRMTVPFRIEEYEEDHGGPVWYIP